MSEISEKQKMLSGQWYLGFDPELVAERERAKKLCFQFNQLSPERRKQGRGLIKQLFGACSNTWIEPPFYCDYGYNISAGKGFYCNHGVTILDCAPVTFGDDVLIAPGVIISAATHHLDAEKRRLGLEQALPISIGNNVWIGMGAKILPGVKIGDNAVIAAGAVVNKNVDPDTVVAGVPAKPIPTTPT